MIGNFECRWLGCSLLFCQVLAPHLGGRHPWGMDDGWTGKHFFIEFQFTINTFVNTNLTSLIFIVFHFLSTPGHYKWHFVEGTKLSVTLGPLSSTLSFKCMYFFVIIIKPCPTFSHELFHVFIAFTSFSMFHSSYELLLVFISFLS
jgi:hypothetical protein